MQKTPSLEDFIKTYVNNKSIAEKKESYAEWIVKNGEKIPGYSDTALGLNTSLAHSRIGYGSEGNRQAESGLLDSGYLNYLNSRKKAENAALILKAKDEENARYESERMRYSAYVDAFNKEVDKISASVSSALSKTPTTDYDKAYEYAISAGLPKERAEEIAKESTEKETNRLKEIVLDSIGKDKLTSGEAYDYAITLGLNKDIAKELSTIANKRNEVVDISEEELLIRKLNAKERIETKRNKKG